MHTVYLCRDTVIFFPNVSASLDLTPEFSNPCYICHLEPKRERFNFGTSSMGIKVSALHSVLRSAPCRVLLMKALVDPITCCQFHHSIRARRARWDLAAMRLCILIVTRERIADLQVMEVNLHVDGGVCDCPTL